MEVNPLIPIGAKIKVEKSKIENVLPKKFLDQLPRTISGEVVDYKMTDGIGIGYVLMTENNTKIWIFNNELNEQTKKEYKIKDIDVSSNDINQELIIGKYKVNYIINGNRDIKSIMSPINIVSWLIFTLKDIF